MSTGLLVFTQDGSLVRSIIGERPGCAPIEKEYLVQVRLVNPTSSTLSPSQMRYYLNDVKGNNPNMLRTGRIMKLGSSSSLSLLRDSVLRLDGEVIKPMSVDWEWNHHRRGDDAQEGELRFVLTEGKQHHIRRVCLLLGLGKSCFSSNVTSIFLAHYFAACIAVTKLHRVRIGSYCINDVPLGEYFLR